MNIKKENGLLIKQENGIVSSIQIAGDSENMNWIYKDHKWGEIVFCSALYSRWNSDPLKLETLEENGNRTKSVFANKTLRATVVRELDDNGVFFERYTFKNISTQDILLKNGDIGIVIPINDCYTYAVDSLRLCCNAHIWCGESIAWINALRQGASEQNLGLVLTEGSINKYTQIAVRTADVGDHPRGDIILHTAPCDLLPDEEFSVAWELFVHSGTDEFLNIISQKQAIKNITADRYTVFSGENMQFSFETDEENVRIVLDGNEVPYKKSNNRYSVCHKPSKYGDHRFDIFAGKYQTHIQMFSTNSYEELIRRRVNFIVDHQQYHRKGSMLDGAYLVYDNKENMIVYDDINPNHNAGRERLGMGLLVARYLQSHDDKKAYESLMQYVEFIKREIFDTESGKVYNTVGKSEKRLRLYNAPWVIQFFAEMYMLTRDFDYIEYIHKALNNYYLNGGVKFYPNAIRPLTVYNAVKLSGNMEYTEEALRFFKAHADQMLSVGLNYPPHECVYEQTIVTPAVTFICELGLITGEKKYLDGIGGHIEALDRFSGMQPDCRLNGIPIRYWDGYWFGKSMLYGDTFPHYWSCLSADSWDDYATLSGDKQYRDMAENCIRNCMCVYDEDGRGSCAYLYPYFINETPGEFNDEWANDQDYALYYLMRITEDSDNSVR